MTRLCSRAATRPSRARCSATATRSAPTIARASAGAKELPRRIHVVRDHDQPPPDVLDVHRAGDEDSPSREPVRPTAGHEPPKRAVGDDRLLGERDVAPRRPLAASASAGGRERHLLRRDAGRLFAHPLRGSAARQADGRAAKRNPCRPENRQQVSYEVAAGKLILFESWLRHEVASNPTRGERVSISFNYDWV